MSEIVKKLEEISVQLHHEAVLAGAPVDPMDAVIREAIAALQPSSAEREETAIDLEYRAKQVDDEIEDIVRLTSEKAKRIASLVRTPVAVDDAMLERGATAIFNTWAALEGSEMLWHEAVRAADNPELYPRMARIVPMCRAEAKACVEAALQAGRK